MTTQEAIDYINQHTWSQWKLGLERVRELLERLGGPQRSLRFLHIAGSNGKGSASAMLERILREAGYRTGFFPSPYIEDFRERIQVCGTWIPEEDLARITEQVRVEADAMEDHPSQFELVTAIGMLYFAEQQCDIVVLEVGLGGEFDATNVIEAPEVAVMMNIGLEHTEYLGDTLAKIARTKAGIIKPGCDVVSYPQEKEAADVLQEVCAERGCPLHEVRHDDVELLHADLDGQTFRWNKENTYQLRLLGSYQLLNAATVLRTIHVLRDRGWKIPEEAVLAGLKHVEWPARFEVLCREPLFILDGGHNPQCAEALAKSIRQYVPSEKVVFLMGMLGDKDVASVIEIVLPLAECFVCVTPDSERALPAEELAARLRAAGAEALATEDVSEGVRKAMQVAKEKDRSVIAFGSLYMAGEIRCNCKRTVNDSKR